MNEPQREIDQCRWQPVKNTAGEDIPPYGVVEIGEYDPTDGILKVVLPTEDSQVMGLAVNGPVTLTNNGYGDVTRDFHNWAAYDPASDTPAFGDTLGTVAGSSKLTAGKTGFKVLAPGDSTNKRVMVDLGDATISVVICVQDLT